MKILSCCRADAVSFRSIFLAVVLLVSSAALGQSLPNPTRTPSPDIPSSGRKQDDAEDMGSPENEMRAKMIIKEEKRRYDENVGRAREVSQLASQVQHSYEARQALNSDDEKRLERLEKLTKRIRNEAGGSDSDDERDGKDVPGELREAIKKVTEMADELQKMVEKTPRQVISAAVIDQANKLMALVQRVRGTRH